VTLPADSVLAGFAGLAAGWVPRTPAYVARSNSLEWLGGQLADVMVNNWRPCASIGHVPGQAAGELAGHRRVAGDWLWCERMVTAITRRIVRGVVPGRMCAPRPALAELSAAAFRDHDALPGSDRTEPGR
jgi:hypothetical protein